VHSFNDIHRGVPLISPPSWSARCVSLRTTVSLNAGRAPTARHEYWLTPAGEGCARSGRARQGNAYTHDRIKRPILIPPS